MFVQILEGKVSDVAGLRRQLDRWRQELKPGAEGYLGSTGGVAEDGTGIAMVRFESEEAARRNAGRPEQGQWWAETTKCYEGDVSFIDTTDLEVTLEPTGEPGFVQVMQGRCRDRRRMTDLEREMESTLRRERPDLIGDVRAWNGDVATMFAYFTDEAAAREGEAKPLPEHAVAGFQEWQSLWEGMRFIDLKEPWLDTA
jgi:hypothetical protein